jgi:uncharacterized phage protein (TIGR01671 family)
MNREIKFRVWDSSEKRFLPYPCCFNHLNFNEFTCFDRWFKCDEDGCVAQQYTGLKDKDGKEIYEGDILKTERLWSMTGVVAFEEGGFSLKSNDEFYYLNQICGRSTEVIGNIFGM